MIDRIPPFARGLLALAALLSPALLHAAPPERLVIGVEAKLGLSIVDPAAENQRLWNHPLGAVHDLHLLPNGNFLTQDGYKKLVELNLAGETVWSYDATIQNAPDATTKFEIHSYQRLADGSTLIAESGRSRVIEVDSAGALLRQFPLAVSASKAHSDTRLVRKLDNGHLLVAHEADQMVKEYDAEGKVVWEYAIPLFGKEPAPGHGPEAFGGRCFAALRTARGTTLITTGNGHSVLEVSPAGELLWELHQNDLPGITLAWVTTIAETVDGTLMIGNCHAGPENPQIIEVSREKEVLWSYRDFTNFGNSLANTLVLDGEPARNLRAALAQLPKVAKVAKRE